MSSEEIIPATADAAEADLPVTVIEPKPGWHFIDLRELWRYRELLFVLTWRDIKVRYKQMGLGIAWAVLQPLATTVVFALFLGQAAGGSSNPGSGNVAYPLFVFAGLLPWFFFSSAVTSASQSVVGSQNLVTKVYFPRLLIPLGAVGASLVDFVVSFGILLCMMLWYQTPPGWGILLVPCLALVLLIAATGVGTLLSALTVAYRDFRYVVPFMVQLWMFATPCIYLRETGIGARGQALLPLNPAYGLIANFRTATLGGEFDWYALAVSGGVSLCLLLAGLVYFRRTERSFADVI
jgi:lipopolysaccharide transport system permease protein